MGLLGLLCARQFGLPVYGTYHTDFPAYAARLCGDTRMEQTSWRFMRWFYGQLQQVAAPSPSTRDLLVGNGLDPSRVHVVGRGIDPSRFSPHHRDHALRTSWGGTRMHWLLYVGRLSREKNLGCLAAAFRQVARRRTDVGLVVTGDGPYRAELEQELAGLPVVFTGEQRGEELARTYASADLFVFPSETDTLGVVLLEAQASGLPVIVSAHGGPKDCMRPGETGWIVDPMEPDRLAKELERALGHGPALGGMSEAARRFAAGHTWARSFSAFWDLHGLPAVPAQGASHG
jgi:glycosyltransferase involved in cell wall biosynthesis